MNIRDLQYLVSLADHGHFGKAAKESHVSQPTLSMQIKKLEAYLDVQLVERTPKHIMLTNIGAQISERARIILAEIQDIRAIAKSAQTPYSGDFRLGAFPTLAPYILPLVVPAIHQKLPNLKLLLIEEKTDALLEALKIGALDAALLALPINQEHIEYIDLFDDPFLLAVSTEHPWAQKNEVRLQDIGQNTLLLLEEGHCLRSQALDVCNILGISEYPDFRATSLETLRQMIIANVGTTLIPRIAAKKTKGIIYIPFAPPIPERKIALVFRTSSPRKLSIHKIHEIILGRIKDTFIH